MQNPTSRLALRPVLNKDNELAMDEMEDAFVALSLIELPARPRLEDYWPFTHVSSTMPSHFADLPFSHLVDDPGTSSTAMPADVPSSTTKRICANVKCFLDLPAEIRNRIYDYSLGGHEVHVGATLVHAEEVEAFSGLGRYGCRPYNAQTLTKAQRYGRKLYRSVRPACTVNRNARTGWESRGGRQFNWVRFGRVLCNAPGHFDRAYEECKRTKSSQDKVRGLIRKHEDGHLSCMQRFTGRHRAHYKNRHEHPKLSLNLLATCRQVYEEAALIPFAENTFSFESLHDLTDFVDLVLTPAQKAVVTKINLYDPDKLHGHGSAMFQYLQQPTLDSLEILKELRITLQFEDRLTMAPISRRAIPKQKNLKVKVLLDFPCKKAADRYDELYGDWFKRDVAWEIEEMAGKGEDATEYGWVDSR